MRTPQPVIIEWDDAWADHDTWDPSIDNEPYLTWTIGWLVSITKKGYTTVIDVYPDGEGGVEDKGGGMYFVPKEMVRRLIPLTVQE